MTFLAVGRERKKTFKEKKFLGWFTHKLKLVVLSAKFKRKKKKKKKNINKKAGKTF